MSRGTRIHAHIHTRNLLLHVNNIFFMHIFNINLFTLNLFILIIYQMII